MTVRQKFGIAIVSVILMSVGSAWLATPKGSPTKQPYPTSEESAARVKAGPYVINTNNISQHETLRTVVIPSEFGPILDQRCLLYTNQRSNTSSLACPSEAPRTN